MVSPLVLVYNIGLPNYTLILPLFGGSVNLVDWGDGSTSNDGSRSHTYTSSGIYTVSVYGAGITMLSYAYDNGATGQEYLTQCTDFGNIGLTDLSFAFRLTPLLTTIPSVLPTGSIVTNMQGIFQYAGPFTTDITGWDVSNVTNMQSAFTAVNLFNQNISVWDVSKVTNMQAMFDGATSFNQDISGWDISLVTNMVSMFSGATAFNNGGNALNWGSKTSNVTNMNNMFVNAQAFNQNISGWDVSKVTSMNGTFAGAQSFNQDITNWDVSLVTNMASMFASASVFNQPLLWGNKTSNVKYMSSMFSGASAFNQDISAWDVSSVINMNGMFSSASAFNQNISAWDVSNVTDMSNMFQAAIAFNQPLISWNVSQVQYMGYMFQNASSFNQPLYLWNVQNVLYMNNMFDMATVFNQPLNNWSFTVIDDISSMFFKAFAFNQDISSWNVSTVTNMSATFSLATSFNQDISSWNVSNVQNMSYMFNTAIAFNQPLNNWNVSNVLNMTSMFTNAVVFNKPLNNWNVSNVYGMSNMFQGAIAFNQDISSWNVSLVESMNSMFQSASSFNQPLNNWNVSNVYDMTGIFAGSSLSTSNYNAILNSWSTLTLQPNVTMGVLGLIYTSAGVGGHNILTNSPNNWSILGDAYVPDGVNKDIPFTFTYYNTIGLTSGNQYQLFYLGNPISSTVTYDGVSNTLNFTNVLLNTSGVVPIVLKNNTGAFDVVTFTTNIQSICFKEDTKILTNKGYIPIQNLRKGDFVKTLKHNYVPINIIGRSTIHNPSNEERSKERLYKCSKEQYPELMEDLIITGCHSILVDEFTNPQQREKTAEVLTRIFVTDCKYRLPACVDERASVYEIPGSHTIYHLALENDDYLMNYGIYANGLLVETSSKRYLKELSKMELL